MRPIYSGRGPRTLLICVFGLDIAILHTIVSAAQDEIDSAPDPKPLPAAALFKAYDRILPENGIDPDDDHHLSAFVFRVGGERGQGSLPDKLHTILGRMGIELEFGEDNALSVRSSPSPAPPESPPTRLSTFPPRPYTKELPVIDSDPPDTASFSRPASQHGVGESIADDASDFSRSGIEEALESARRMALSSALYRWRQAASQNRRVQGRLALANSSRMTAPPAPAPSAAPYPQDVPDDVENRIAHPITSRSELQVQTEEEEKKSEAEEAPNAVAKPSRTNPRPIRSTSLLAVMNRWSAMAAKARDLHRLTSVEGRRTSALKPLSAKSSKTTELAESSTVVAAEAKPEINGPTGFVEESDTRRGSPKPSTVLAQAKPKLATPPRQTTLARDEPRTPNPEAEKVALFEREQRLLARAGRAREIYLASKVFNHWADKTARRLEREAVAWRHMIRFRYFRGWCQAPNSRTPIVDQMRAGTAAQKLRRAVAEQQAHFKLAAEAALRSHQQRKVHRALEKWSCLVSASKARDRGQVRKRDVLLKRWSQRAHYNARLGHIAAEHMEKTNHADILFKWSRKANDDLRRNYVAEQIGLGWSSYQFLQEWWDQAEASRRAQVYRQNLLVSKAIRAFDQWNLQARAQAFVWRTEYLSVSRVFDQWMRLSRQDGELRGKAQTYQTQVAVSKVIGCWKAVDNSRSKLDRLERRVQLYIGSMRLLDTFTQTVTRNQLREKVALKRHLRQRYQQVSSARKRRNFFSALDKWQSLTLYNRRHAALATEMVESREINRVVTAVDRWHEQAMADEVQSMDAHLHYVRAWWNAWNEASWSYRQRGSDAWDLWASGTRYQYQKAWSNSSIQQRGHAHTAAVVEERHDRDKQRRTFNYWRARVDPGKSVRFDTVPQSAPEHRPSHPFRMSWKTASVLRSQLGRNQGVPNYQPLQLETPTRWTGQMVPMSNVLSARPMPSLREAEEKSSAPSSITEDELLVSPSRRQVERTYTPNLPTTTPRGPVPTHLEPPFQTQTGPPWIRSSLGDASLVPGESSRFQYRGIKRKSPSAVPNQTDTNPIPSTKYAGYHTTPINFGAASMGADMKHMPTTIRSTVPYTPARSAIKGKSLLSRPSRTQTADFRKSESSIPIPSIRTGPYIKR
ncbi:unnamed protein product [Clonostachys rosea]|uniref:Sfi1 spindle body domain-containing protein n=1 Tax=Bionectria ochroleuca TaxID=29856 RepID=A0ABY6U8G1_BIOOC|nr:unnamed protein product [Clonostachys rosea]